MKKIGLFSLLVLMTGLVMAQSIEEGKKLLNYERFQSAADVFEKILAKEPENTKAAYWLGQTYLQNYENVDTAAAKKLYQAKLQANPNEPMLLVGMGEIALMAGNKEVARNMFETAIDETRKRDLPETMLAIGIATVDAKQGDPHYAIPKLKQALERDEKNVELLITLGNNYRKLIDGANAVTAYQNALLIDPTVARADFMIGRIYETQGFGQEVIYMRFYNDAIAANPDFAPVYYWLYGYYYNRDVNKAREYLAKYIDVIGNDNSVKLCYAQASLYYVSEMYEKAIAKADSCINSASSDKPFPNLYGLKGYAYEKMDDSAKAKAAFEEFFKIVNPDLIGPNDYATYAKVLTQFHEKDKALEAINKALALDTLVKNKVNYIQEIAKELYKEKRYHDAGTWYEKVLEVDTGYGKVDLYWTGFAYYLGQNFEKSDSIFTLYQNQYPEDLFGWYLGARSKEGMDTSDPKLGLAKYDYQMIINLTNEMNKDSLDQPAINKLIPAYRYMLAYQYNVLENVDSANYYNEQILLIVPTDPTALQVQETFKTIIEQRKQMQQQNPDAKKEE